MAHFNADLENDSEVSSVFSQHQQQQAVSSNRATVGATGTYIPAASLPASLVQPNLVSQCQIYYYRGGRLCSAMGTTILLKSFVVFRLSSAIRPGSLLLLEFAMS